MFNKNNWKEPINKEDLRYVLFNGILGALVAGAFGGAINYLVSLISSYIIIDLSFMALLIIVPWRVKKSFYENHILYAVLGVVFLFLGFFVAHFTEYLITGILVQKPFAFLASYGFYTSFLLLPVDGLIIGILTLNPLYIFLGALNLLCYAYAFFYTYTSIRRKR